MYVVLVLCGSLWFTVVHDNEHNIKSRGNPQLNNTTNICQLSSTNLTNVDSHRCTRSWEIAIVLPVYPWIFRQIIDRIKVTVQVIPSGRCIGAVIMRTGEIVLIRRPVQPLRGLRSRLNNRRSTGKTNLNKDSHSDLKTGTVKRNAGSTSNQSSTILILN